MQESELEERVLSGVMNLDSMLTIEKLQEFASDAALFQQMKRNGGHRYSKQIDLLIKSIKSRIDYLTPTWYFYMANPITGNEVINGYRMYEGNSFTFRYVDFKILDEAWDLPDISRQEFYLRFDATACVAWNLHDKNGIYSGGFYRCKEGTYEKQEAFTLTRNDNCEGLWKLPYPKLFILESIRLLCSTNGVESVRYCNFVGEWVAG